MHVVKLENVSKRINGKEIIDNVSFKVKKGEVLGLLGTNGAGKTTIIRLIVGLVRASSGTITISGHDNMLEYEKATEKLGAIVESPEFYPFMSGYQNLKYFSKMYRDITEEQIDKLVELSGLSNRIHDKLSEYSLGMKQRLGIAQALLNSPNILILDEPTNGLDPAGIQELRQHIRYLAKEKELAIIISSHLIHEVELICDRVAIINEGKLVALKDIQDKKQYIIEVSNPNEAVMFINKRYSLNAKKYDKEIELSFIESTMEISTIIKQLVKNNFLIYRVELKKNYLENDFLNLTSKLKE